MTKVYVVSIYNYSTWGNRIKFISTNKDEAFEYFEKHSNTGFFNRCWSIQEWQGEKYKFLKTKIK